MTKSITDHIESLKNLFDYQGAPNFMRLLSNRLETATESTDVNKHVAFVLNILKAAEPSTWFKSTLAQAVLPLIFVNQQVNKELQQQFLALLSKDFKYEVIKQLAAPHNLIHLPSYAPLVNSLADEQLLPILSQIYCDSKPKHAVKLLNILTATINPDTLIALLTKVYIGRNTIISTLDISIDRLNKISGTTLYILVKAGFTLTTARRNQIPTEELFGFFYQVIRNKDQQVLKDQLPNCSPRQVTELIRHALENDKLKMAKFIYKFYIDQNNGKNLNNLLRYLLTHGKHFYVLDLFNPQEDEQDQKYQQLINSLQTQFLQLIKDYHEDFNYPLKREMLEKLEKKLALCHSIKTRGILTRIEKLKKQLNPSQLLSEAEFNQLIKEYKTIIGNSIVNSLAVTQEYNIVLALALFNAIPPEHEKIKKLFFSSPDNHISAIDKTAYSYQLRLSDLSTVLAKVKALFSSVSEEEENKAIWPLPYIYQLELVSRLQRQDLIALNKYKPAYLESLGAIYQEAQEFVIEKLALIINQGYGFTTELEASQFIAELIKTYGLLATVKIINDGLQADSEIVAANSKELFKALGDTTTIIDVHGYEHHMEISLLKALYPDYPSILAGMIDALWTKRFNLNNTLSDDDLESAYKFLLQVDADIKVQLLNETNAAIIHYFLKKQIEKKTHSIFEGFYKLPLNKQEQCFRKFPAEDKGDINIKIAILKHYIAASQDVSKKAKFAATLLQASKSKHLLLFKLMLDKTTCKFAAGYLLEIFKEPAQSTALFVDTAKIYNAAITNDNSAKEAYLTAYLNIINLFFSQKDEQAIINTIISMAQNRDYQPSLQQTLFYYIYFNEKATPTGTSRMAQLLTKHTHPNNIAIIINILANTSTLKENNKQKIIKVTLDLLKLLPKSESSINKIELAVLAEIFSYAYQNKILDKQVKEIFSTLPFEKAHQLIQSLHDKKAKLALFEIYNDEPEKQAQLLFNLKFPEETDIYNDAISYLCSINDQHVSKPAAGLVIKDQQPDFTEAELQLIGTEPKSPAKLQHLAAVIKALIDFRLKPDGHRYMLLAKQLFMQLIKTRQFDHALDLFNELHSIPGCNPQQFWLVLIDKNLSSDNAYTIDGSDAFFNHILNLDDPIKFKNFLSLFDSKNQTNILKALFIASTQKNNRLESNLNEICVINTQDDLINLCQIINLHLGESQNDIGLANLLLANIVNNINDKNIVKWENFDEAIDGLCTALYKRNQLDLLYNFIGRFDKLPEMQTRILLNLIQLGSEIKSIDDINKALFATLFKIEPEPLLDLSFADKEETEAKKIIHPDALIRASNVIKGALILYKDSETTVNNPGLIELIGMVLNAVGENIAENDIKRTEKITAYFETITSIIGIGSDDEKQEFNNPLDKITNELNKGNPANVLFNEVVNDIFRKIEDRENKQVDLNEGLEAVPLLSPEKKAKARDILRGTVTGSNVNIQQNGPEKPYSVSPNEYSLFFQRRSPPNRNSNSLEFFLQTDDDPTAKKETSPPINKNNK